jgi:hypothetical protein
MIIGALFMSIAEKAWKNRGPWSVTYMITNVRAGAV